MNTRRYTRPLGILVLSFFAVSCGEEAPPEVNVTALETVEPRPEIYADFTLTADLSHLSDEQKQMVALLIDAAQIMDDLFWRQSFGDDYEAWLDSIADDKTRRFAELNYGPWDALNDDKPFMEGYGPNPLGAQFYP